MPQRLTLELSDGEGIDGILDAMTAAFLRRRNKLNLPNRRLSLVCV